ncbi:cytochrome ubiquinol oxidase subunit I [Vibrio lentus]|nr:cytochrome ubiquinol oxidase subunit I [Vibrio lentus]
MAADDSIPTVWPLFWSFRLMVVASSCLFVFGAAFVQACVVRRSNRNHGYLKRRYSPIPLPWIAIEAGWFVAEFGRQPWAVGEILPVNVAASALTIEQLWTSLFIFWHCTQCS